MSEKKPVRETIAHGEYVIRLRWEPWENGVGWVDFEIIAATARDAETDKPWYKRDGADDSMDMVDDLDKAQVGVSGFVKWDGCTQFWLEDEPVHFDDPRGLAEWCEALQAARAAAKKTCTTESAGDYK